MKKLKFVGGLLIAIFGLMIGNKIVKGEEISNFKSLTFKDSEIKYADKLYVNLDMQHVDESTIITGSFGGAGQYFNLVLKDINTPQPYFETAGFMKPGETYTLLILNVKESTGDTNYGCYECAKFSGKEEKIKIKNVAKITNLKIVGDRQVKLNGKFKVRLDTDIPVDYVTIFLHSKVRMGGALVYIEPNTDYTIDLTNLGTQYLSAGEYYISDVYFDPTDSSKYIHYSFTPSDNTTLKLEHYVDFTIYNEKANQQQNTVVNKEKILKSISLSTSSAKLNEKISVDLETSKDITSATLVFSNEKESITVNLKDVNSKFKYFIVPFTANEGTYDLDYVVLKDNDGKEYQYRKGDTYYDIEHFEFNTTLKIENALSTGNLLSLDNDKITTDIVNKIGKLNSNLVIEINSNNNPVIKKELFEIIKGTNKTIIVSHNGLEWVFNGLDVKKEKQIDVSANIQDINEISKLKNNVDSGIVIDFSDNGDLPGKCLIKVHNSELVSKIMNKGNANIYYYNDKTNKFEIVKLDSKYNNDGYYEFYIDHNSKYVITTNKIDDKYISNSTKSNLNNNGINMKSIIFISVPVVIVLIISIVIIYIIKRNKKNKDKIIDKDINNN